MKIFANSIVNNEENFIWFSIMSVVDFVDKILIWDTGSTDKTVEIIKEVVKTKGKKIEFKEIGSVDKFKFTKMRQKMLEESDCDFILILDGDEIWWEESIKKLRKTVDEKGSEIEGIVVPMKVPVGDIYHLQEERAGRYKLLGRAGHISLKAINRNIPGLHVDLPYGREGYFDKNNQPIQEKEKIVFLDAPFLHVTHLQRSPRNSHHKFKYELGLKCSSDFSLPEVFYKRSSQKIKSPFTKRSKLYEFIAFFAMPYLNIKRGLENE